MDGRRSPRSASCSLSRTSRDAARSRRRSRTAPRAPPGGARACGVIGAGTFARGVLLPALRKARGASPRWSPRPAHQRRRRGRALRLRAAPATDPEEVIGDRRDRRDRHRDAPRQPCRATRSARSSAGKHVFVEKPLALDARRARRGRAGGRGARPGMLMVGFNRRFAPLTRAAARRRSAAAARWSSPTASTPGGCRADHWLHDPQRRRPDRRRGLPLRRPRGAFLPGRRPVERHARAPSTGRRSRARTTSPPRCASRTASSATILYARSATRACPRSGSRSWARRAPGMLDDFRELDAAPRRARETPRARRDKGHAAELGRSPTRAGPASTVAGRSTAVRSCARRSPSGTRCRAARRSCGSSSSRQYFPPEAGATQNRLGAFVDGLVARGHEVTVVVRAAQPPRRGLRTPATGAGRS